MWGILLSLTCLAALCLASPVHSAAPPPAQKDEPGPPLFEPEFLTNPVHMAMQVFGASTAPRTGGFAAVGVVIGGDHPRVRSWNLENPLTQRYNRVWLAAATLVGNSAPSTPGFGSAFSAFGTLKAGEWYDCWIPRDTDKFYRLPKEWLTNIVDGKEPRVGGAEALAFSRVLKQAHFTSDKAFESAVRTDLNITHMREDPDRYRGEVVRVQGKLEKVNRYDPPFDVAEEGVSDYFEAWISNGPQPYRVIFTHWPEGLDRKLLGQEKITDPPIVTFDGYFFKILRNFEFSINKRKVQRDVPLIMGNTLRVKPIDSTTKPDDPRWVKDLAIGFVVVFVAALIGVLALTIWLRRTDNRVRRRLFDTRSPEFILPPPDQLPAVPVAPPVHKGELVSAPPRFHIPPGLGDRPPEGGPPGRGGDRGSSDDPPEDAGS